MAETFEHDIVIVGGGGAGLRAAIAVAERNPELSVALLSKVYPMRSHTVTAEGGAAGVVKPNDDLETHCYDTVSGADWLADQDAVEILVNDAPRQLTQLEHWGCPWSREPDGSVAVRSFGGMKNQRTWYAADKSGFHMLHSLFQTTLKYPSITRYDEHYAAKLLQDGERCGGVAALDLRTGDMRAITGNAVILATGGAGYVFAFTTNGAIKTGEGMALAYRAGVPLKDMEFVQYHPTGLPGTGILITEAARGEGGIMLNRHGRRYLQDYDLGQPLEVTDPRHPQNRMMELGPRDRLSQAFHYEREKGNTFKMEEFEDVDAVHLDIRHLGEKRIDERLPFVRELCRDYQGIDPVHEPIPIRPVVHYTMGGIDTDIDGRTTLPGLYAAGECACVSVNGANRLGSNSLVEILVFGERAANAAAEEAGERKRPNADALKTQAEDETKHIQQTLLNGASANEGVRPAHVRNKLRKVMEDGCGIFRDGGTIQTACDALAELSEQGARMTLDDHGGAYNTQLINALEITGMLEVASAMAHSAHARTESRGSHQRTDYPERDDAQFLKHSLAYRQEGGAPRIDWKDVTITRWPPGERTYGR